LRVPIAVPATARAGRINRERPIVIESNCSWKLVDVSLVLRSSLNLMVVEGERMRVDDGSLTVIRVQFARAETLFGADGSDQLT
jgi:hypothetical protein